MTLKVVTRRIAAGQVPKPDLLFARKSNVLVGQGVALRLSATGENRISELSELWKKTCLEAQIDDQVKLPGSGLVAFASITFSANSPTESVLVIPQRLYVIREEGTFLTEVLGGAEVTEELVPPREFESGQASANRFRENVVSAITAIQSTELEKVVLSRDLVMNLPGQPDLSIPLQRLQQRYPDCWTYRVEGVFGASPELLIRGDRGEVSARVLAGTAGRGTDPDVDRAIADGLAHSNKNIHEHRYAVQSMVQELEPFCDWVEADQEPFSLALPDLWHLATDVRGKLKPNTSLLDVVARLHPTAAVAGTPRDKATELIAQLESKDRAGYAGPVGWLASDGSGELAIALRGGVIEKTESGTQIRAIAGCGIVAESDPDAELAETELKFRAVRYAFED